MERTIPAMLSLFMLASCFAAKAPDAELEKISHDVLSSKNHEGIDIRITPVEEEKAEKPKVESVKR